MNEQQLFRTTRWRLASWYAGIMGLILALFSLGFYEAIDHAHREATDRELEAIAGRLHDSLEPHLLQPGVISKAALRYLPNSCVLPSACFSTGETQHTPGAVFQGRYFIRLLSPTGKLLAIAGLKSTVLSPSGVHQAWQTLQDAHQNRYRQITLTLQNQDAPLWGYLQVGSSLQESDQYLASVRLALLFGLPISLGFIGFASWWLAGRAMHPIYQSYQQMQQFTADAAHELRTPIAAAQATVESVLDAPDLSKQETLETFQVLDRQHRRLANLTQDLLLLTRLEKRRSFEGVICALHELIEDVTEELAALALTQQLEFSAQIHQPLWVKGNADQLYRLLFNLVINAFHYTAAGGQVSVILEAKDHKAQIQVRDTGIGIAPDDQGKIFDRFYRVDRDRSRQSGGSGLGLSIAQAIAQMHQGSISVQSQVGQGSTFTVLLPTVDPPTQFPQA